MTTTIRTRIVAGAGLFAAAALTLAGCAAPPAETTDTSAPTEPALDFTPCMVSDAGGFDDRSFNQLGYEGITEAAEELGVEAITVESADESEYAPNIESLLDQDCDLIVTVGFALSAATVEYATDNPDVMFAIVDDAADNDFDGTVDADNIKPILFDTAQAAFLAGYAMADYSESGVVGTYGGMEFPTVSIFMDGVKQGIDYYNEENGGEVELLGWDGETGVFIGTFDAGTESRNAAQNLIDQDADILLPVGGPIYQSAIEAVADSGEDIAMIGVDADLTETDPDNASYFMTSILKQIKVAVHDVVTEASAGELDTTAYIGTLENGGVGIAPFHDFESMVSPELQDTLDELAQGIIAGDIPVTSYLSAAE